MMSQRQILATLRVCLYHAAGRAFWTGHGRSPPVVAPVRIVIARLARHYPMAKADCYVAEDGATVPYLRVRDTGPLLWGAPPVFAGPIALRGGPATGPRPRFFRRQSQPFSLEDRRAAKEACQAAARRHIGEIMLRLNRLRRRA